MGRLPASALWKLRDDRTLSEHAKLAYVMLWTRQPDIRPALATLGADMGASKSTAKRAVRELEAAGLLKRVTRLSEHGDNDPNVFYLVEPESGRVTQTPPQGQSDPPGRASQAPKDSNPKEGSEGRDARVSRRAQAPLARADVLGWIRRAITLSYGAVDSEDLTDGQIIALWYLLAGKRRPRDPVAYFCKIFDETPDIYTHVANAGTEEDWTR